MALLQGNSYQLPIMVKNAKCEIVTPEDVARIQFIFGGVVKYYGGNGVVTYNEDTKCFIVPLTEEETFSFNDSTVQWQIRIKYKDGSIDGTVPKQERIYSTITTEMLGGN